MQCFQNVIFANEKQNVMKKFFFFALLLVIFLPMPAQVKVGARALHQPEGFPTLNVTSSFGVPFWIYIDEVQQTDNPVASICLQNLPVGDLYVRVELDNQDHNSIGRFVTINDRSIYLSIVRQGALYGLQTGFSGVHPQFMQPLVVNEPPKPPHPVPGGLQPVSHCMNDVDFSEALHLIQKESFDSSRLSIAKQVASSNQLCVRQIIEICQKFSFESNRLEFAKYAYAFCSERDKYYMVNKAFSYESSKRELDAFIKPNSIIRIRNDF